MMTRRHWMVGGFGIISSAPMWSSDFWTAKDAAEWSEKDIQRLMTRSPWAKEVSVQLRGGSALGGGNMPSGGGRRGGRGGGGSPSWDASSSGSMGGSPISAGGMGPGGGMGGGAPEGRPSTPELRTTVRWESAKAIRDGRKKATRPEDAPFYILSVGPLPLMPNQDPRASGVERRNAMQEKLKEITQLQRRGHDPIVPDRAALVEGTAAAVLLFYFPRDPNPIQADDKEVTFSTAYGPLEIRAKFPLKDMSYRSQLDL